MISSWVTMAVIVARMIVVLVMSTMRVVSRIVVGSTGDRWRHRRPSRCGSGSDRSRRVSVPVDGRRPAFDRV